VRQLTKFVNVESLVTCFCLFVMVVMVIFTVMVFFRWFNVSIISQQVIHNIKFFRPLLDSNRIISQVKMFSGENV